MKTPNMLEENSDEEAIDRVKRVNDFLRHADEDLIKFFSDPPESVDPRYLDRLQLELEFKAILKDSED